MQPRTRRTRVSSRPGPPLRPTAPTCGPVYRRRRPTLTPLYPLVQHHLETFIAQAAEADPGLWCRKCRRRFGTGTASQGDVLGAPGLDRGACCTRPRAFESTIRPYRRRAGPPSACSRWWKTYLTSTLRCGREYWCPNDAAVRWSNTPLYRSGGRRRLRLDRLRSATLFRLAAIPNSQLRNCAGLLKPSRSNLGVARLFE